MSLNKVIVIHSSKKKLWFHNMPVTIPVRKKSTCVDYLLYAMPMPFPSSCAVNHCNNTVIRNFYSLFQNSKHVGSKKLNLKIS